MKRLTKARYVMIGGFLGAGKTTCVAKLAQQLTTEGLKVGLITNDQGSELVDTAMLRSRGFATEEIPGGCFCCRFNSLVDAAGRLTEKTRPDVFIAEPVGSCTDLVATVTYPLRRMVRGRFRDCAVERAGRSGPGAASFRARAGREILGKGALHLPQETCLTLPALQDLQSCSIRITHCFARATCLWKSLESDPTCSSRDCPMGCGVGFRPGCSMRKFARLCAIHLTRLCRSLRCWRSLICLN